MKIENFTQFLQPTVMVSQDQQFVLSLWMPSRMLSMVNSRNSNRLLPLGFLYLLSMRPG